MRKLLLAATAMIGATAGLASVASAQVAPPTVVVTPPPSPYAVLPSQVALPGSAVVRLNVRIFADFAVGGDSGNGYTTPAGVKAKQTPYFFSEFARLYPNFDGQTPNGIKYGASMEVRQNSGGTGANSATNNIAGSAGNTLFWRRETAYVSFDKIGTLRFGQTDGALSLFVVGNFESADTEGGWDGDLPGLFSPNTQVAWTVPDIGAWYTTSKLVYLSPNFAGFDFGIDFEPSNQTSSSTTNCADVAAANVVTSGCATISSISGPYATIATDLSRRRNMVDIMGRYRGSFGPIGLVVEGGIVTSGHVRSGNAPGVDALRYNGFAFGDGGAVVTFGGLAVGGHVDIGQVNNTALLVAGGRHEQSYVAGASYAMGPFIVGVQYINTIFQGAFNGNLSTNTPNTLGPEHDIGYSVGGTFDWAPGISLYADYLYGQKQKSNYDFFAGTAGKFNNKTRAQGAILGTVFRW